jgi:hypothetical protein
MAADLPNIPQQINDYRATHYEQWPVRSNRASILGHPCLRHLVYQRTHWRERAMPDLTLLSIFEEGGVHEQAAIALLNRCGFRVTLQQRAFEYPEHEITGTIDGSLLLNGASVPFDIKSTSSGTWRSIATVDDLRGHAQYYVRSWYSQLQLYMLLSNQPQSLLLLKDKQTGLLKQLALALDYHHCEELIQKADQINAHVRERTIPDRMPYDEGICGRCDFFHICLPDEALRSGATLVDDAAFQAKLERRAALEQAAKEFAQLDEAVKKQAKQTLGQAGECVVGVDWLLRTKQHTRKSFQVPESTYTTVTIQRLGPTAKTRDEDAA